MKFFFGLIITLCVLPFSLVRAEDLDRVHMADVAIQALKKQVSKNSEIVDLHIKTTNSSWENLKASYSRTTFKAPEVPYQQVGGTGLGLFWIDGAVVASDWPIDVGTERTDRVKRYMGRIYCQAAFAKMPGATKDIVVVGTYTRNCYVVPPTPQETAFQPDHFFQELSEENFSSH